MRFSRAFFALPRAAAARSMPVLSRRDGDADDAPLQHRRQGAHKHGVRRGFRDETGLDDVDFQFFQELCHLDLLLEAQAGCKELLAFAQGDVNDFYRAHFITSVFKIVVCSGARLRIPPPSAGEYAT